MITYIKIVITDLGKKLEEDALFGFNHCEANEPKMCLIKG